MNIITKIHFDTAEKLLQKNSTLFNKEIIIPYEQFEKIPKDIVMSLKIRGCYFKFKDNDGECK